MAKGGTNPKVYVGYPPSENYKTALITATNWFYLITVPNTRTQENVSNSPIGLNWLLKAKLRNTSSKAHGGFAQLRPFGRSAPEPTIDLDKDDRQKRHETPGHERVDEVKFVFNKGKREPVSCPPLIPAREPKLGDMNPGPGPIPKPIPQLNPQPAPAPFQFPDLRDWIPPIPLPIPGRQII
jgi:hypothetical protein